MKKLYTAFFIVLGCFVVENLHAQCAPDPSVITIDVDLSANPDTVFILPKNASPKRNGDACVGSNCIRFNVKVHPSTKEIAFSVRNPEPSGAATYMVNCGSPTSIGVPLCVAGMSEFCLTYCKPGGDQPEYVLRATKGFGASDDLYLRNNCSGEMVVDGLIESTVTWTSIYPGAAGAYNSFLSSTSGNDTVSITPAIGAPAYIDYKVCGTAVGCTSGDVCDTVRVYTYPELSANISPAVPALCAGSNSTVMLDAVISGGKPAYSYAWTGPGTFSSTTASTVVNVAGTYSLSVDDQTTCGPVVFEKIVLESQLPNVTSPATGTICSAVAQTYTLTADVSSTTFTWSRAAVAGISEPAVSNQTSDVIDEVLTNTTTDPIDVEYVIVPYSNGCTGATFTYTVTVNPTPFASSAGSSVVCSEEAQNYTIISPVAGTTYTWSRPAVAGISEPAVSGQTGTTITEALTNTTASAIVVAYSIIPEAAGCTGPVFSYDVTVNPKPVVTSTDAAVICNSTAQNYLIESSVAGATFVWERVAIAGIAEAPVSGQTANPITESLTNTTAAAISVTYHIRPVASACQGDVFTYTLTVNPTPNVTSASSAELCNLMQQDYSITSDVSGAVFNWSRDVVLGISNPANAVTNADMITETLENTSTVPVDVTYVIVPNYAGCEGPAFNYVVTVNPTPHVTSASTASVCSSSQFDYNITADVAGTTFTWSRDAVAGISNAAKTNQASDLISETLINTTTAPVDVTYTILPSADGCNGPVFDLVVTVNPTPQVTSGPTGATCNDTEFSYDITADVSGTTFTWSRPAVAGITNAAVNNQNGSQIVEMLNNTTTAPVDVIYYITPEANGCIGETFELTITVTPTVMVTSAGTSVVCSEEAQNYTITANVAGASFTWSRPGVDGISNPALNNQTSDVIVEALENITNSPVTVNYLITPSVDGCNSADFTYSVTVNPKVYVSSAATATICNNGAQNYQITSAVAGATYTWSRAAVAGISNAAVSNQASDVITETLENTTTAPITVVYTITPYFDNCAGEEFSYEVTVNPTSNITSAATATICNNTAQNYALTSDVTGATFTWSRAAVAGISNAAVSNQTSDEITETLVNTTTAPVVVEYIITPSFDGCNSTDFSYKVTVNPTPNVTSASTASVCSSSQFDYSITADVAGTTFTWSRDAVAGITNAAVINQASDLISETLINTTTAPVDVMYTILPSADGCNGPVFDLVVTVNPTPQVTSASTGSSCNDTEFSYDITADVSGTTFTWSRPAVPGISNAAVNNQNGSQIVETLNNSTTAPVDVIYYITPEANGCTGETFTLTVTVTPTVMVTSAGTSMVCSEEAQNYTITANVPGATFTWSRPGVDGISNPALNNQPSDAISEALENITNAPVTVNYIITPSVDGCNSADFTYSVTVNPKVYVSSAATATICNNEAQNYQITSAVAGATYTWSRAAVAGISNAAVSNQASDVITETLDNTTTAPITVVYTITPYFDNCAGEEFSYEVTVNPTSNITSAATATICNNTAQNYAISSDVTGATFTWSRAAVAGISNAAVSNQTSDVITETLINTTTAPVEVEYIITPSFDGCNSTDFSYKVTVNPTSTISSSSTASVCSGSQFDYNITADVAGTTFTWSRDVVAGISNAAVINQASDLIFETLINTTTAPVDVTYNISLSANGCASQDFSLTVTVFPAATVTSVDNTTICNNTAQNYTITSAVAGTTFSWSRPAVAGITNAAATGTSNSITEKLENTTDFPVTVTYQITPTANGCSGETFNYSVTVNPTPVVTSVPAETICNLTALNYNISSNVSGATFTWSRAAVAGIANAAVSNQTGSSITETLNNTTSAPINVIYSIVPAANGCEGPAFTYTVTVNPTAVVNSAASAVICNNTAQNYSINSLISGTTYTWSRDAVSGISNPSVNNQTSDVITETLVNTSTSPVNVIYTITPAANGCDGSTFTYTVTVNPSINITSAATASLCSGETQNYVIASDVSGATFTWSRAVVAGISNAAVNNKTGSTITEALVNTTSAPITVNYIITPSFNGCDGGSFTYEVTVNPTAHVTSDASAVICNNTAQNYSISSDVAGTTFTWSRAAVAGITNPAVSNETGSTITEALQNTSTTPIQVEYIISPTSNGCSGKTFTYRVTVNPTAHVTGNTTAQICNNTAQNYSLASDVSGTSFTWTRDAVNGITNAAATGTGNSITEKLENTTDAPINVAYQITPRANGCDGDAFSYSVTVNPTSLVTSAANGEVCDNESVNYGFSSNVSGATFTFSRAYVSGIANAPISNESGNGISEALHNTTSAPIDVVYVIRATANGCTGPDFKYTVRVNPTAIITGADAATICNNTAQQYDLTSAVSATNYTWSREAVAGVSNPPVSNQTADVITETLVNTTSAPVDVVYSIIPAANGCTGRTFTYTVTVNPSAQVTSAASAEVCSGAAQNYLIKSDVPSASFTWSRASVAGISNPAVNNRAGNLIDEALINTTLDPVTVSYEITPRFDGCDGGTFVYSVTVNPMPHIVSDATASICNNTAQNYTISSDVAGTTFTWSRAAVAGISNAAVSNQSGNLISETLENTSSMAIDVRYVITPSANGCSGQQFNYTIKVLPTTVVNTASEATVCNKSAQNYSIGSNVSGSSFTWSRDAVAGISNPPSSGTSNKITEALENTTTAPITVHYQIDPVANGCQGETFSYAVTVNPSPVVTSGDMETICNKTALDYTITSNVPGTTFTWSRATTPGISNGAVNNRAGNQIDEVLNNTTSSPVNVNYVIIPTANGCAGNPAFNYTVTVNPSATVSSAATARICNKTAQDYLITSAVTGATFTWSRPAVAGISNSAISDQTINPITEALVNTTNQPIAVSYFITPTANNCVSGTFTYTVTVDPTPQSPVASSNAPICLGSNLYLKASTIPNASYKWTGPDGFTSNQQNPSRQNVNSAVEGQYQVEAIVNGCSSEPAITNVSTSNLSSSADAGQSQLVCGNNAEVNVSGNVLGGEGTGLWSTSGTGTFDNPEQLATKYTPSDEDIRNGGVNLTLTTTNTGVCAPTSSSMRVTISPVPVVNAGPDLDVCADKKASLNGLVSVSPSAAWTSNGSGNFYPSNTSLNATYEPSEEDKIRGFVTVKLTSADNGLCLPVEDTATIRIIKLPFVKAGGEITVLEGHKKKITPTVSGTQLQFLWTPNRYLNDNTLQEVIVTGVTDVVYTIKVTGEGGCVAQDEVAIKVLKPFDVPNTFTPNGDGINDTWLIPNLAKYPDCKVQIFNRYGQVVYESHGYVKPWDGLFNGRPLPFGTYYYIIDTGVGGSVSKGYVTLIR
ncbi:MAG: PKD-like domain-containing protein [Flavisolibacter sp.]